MFELGDRVVIRSVNDVGYFFNSIPNVVGRTGEIVEFVTNNGFGFWVKMDIEISPNSRIWACNADEIDLA